MQNPAVPPELVQGEVDRICASKAFRGSARHARFLRFLVDHALAGRLTELKELVIGVEVFGRSLSAFDPRKDTIVRVEARRLRERLREYYAEDGISALVEIDLPTGGYVPTFRLRQIVAGLFPAYSTVAVLPLAVFSPALEDESIGDALTEEIIDCLVRVPGLRVVARTSSFHFKGKQQDVRAIGRALGAAYLLEGSVQAEGNRLRVTTQLVKSTDGLHLWSNSFEVAGETRFERIDTLVERIVRDMVRVLAGGDNGQQLTIRSAQSSVPEAARDILDRARIAFRPRTVASLRTCRDLCEQALQLAPNYAAAHSLHARSLAGLYAMLSIPDVKAIEAAFTSAARAIELNPHDGEAMAVQGMLLLFYRHDPTAAQEALRTAVRWCPSSVYAHHCRGLVQMYCAQYEEADQSFALARALDPLDVSLRTHQIFLRFYERRFDECAQALEAILEVSPASLVALSLLGAARLCQARPEQALQAYKRANEVAPDHVIGRVGSIQAMAMAGDVAGVSQLLGELRASADGARVSPYQYAMIAARMQNSSEAIEHLREAAAQRDYNFPCLSVDPSFDALEKESDLNALLSSHGLPRRTVDNT